MSTTILAVLVNGLVALATFFGVEIGTEQATATIQTLVALVTGLWVWNERRKLRHLNPGEESDITPVGTRK